MEMNDIINRIEYLLKEKHLSMRSLMDNAEISTTVYQWKKNRNRDATRMPSLKSIIKICNFLNISLSTFFAFDKTEELSVKQREIANKLLNLSDDELVAVDGVIDVFIINHTKE